MGKFLKWFDQIFIYLCIGILGIMSLSVIATIILRYFFGIIINSLEESINFLFITTTFLGSVLCVKEKEHIAIENIANILPFKIQLIFRVFIGILIIILQLIVAHFSWKWISVVGNTLTSGLRLQIKYVYSLLPISAYLVIFYQIRSIIGIFIEKQTSIKKEAS